MTGRRKPYTSIGISRLKCACGERAMYQWNCCANHNKWVPMCPACDIKINEIALEIFKVPNREALMVEYRKRVEDDCK